MREYSFFHAFFMPFVSKSFYRDVGLRRRGVGFLFLAVLLLICWVITGVKLQIGFSRFLDNEGAAAMAKMPDIRIEDGVLSADVEQPHLITTEEDGREIPFIMIDTTGEISSLEETDAMLLVTATDMHNRKQGRVQSFRNLTLDLTQENVRRWVGIARIWAVPVLTTVAFFGSFAYRIIVALIYSLLALLISNSMRTRLTYAGCLRIAVMAMVPVIIVDTVHDLFGAPIPGILWWLICVGAACGLVAMGVSACKDAATEQESEFSDELPAVS